MFHFPLNSVKNIAESGTETNLKPARVIHESLFEVTLLAPTTTLLKT